MKEILDKFRKNLRLLPAVFLFIFLGLNIFFSQNISPIFYGLTNFDRKSVVLFLQKIRNQDDFKNQLNYFEEFFGTSLKNDVFAKELSRETRIKEFEQILKKNHYSRDVLYGLYQLYLEKGERNKAGEYLRQARAIDPLVK